MTDLLEISLKFLAMMTSPLFTSFAFDLGNGLERAHFTWRKSAFTVTAGAKLEKGREKTKTHFFFC